MGLYGDHIFPWCLDHTEPREMAGLRRLALADVQGDVLEIGLGTGGSIPCYPETVQALIAVEPREAMRRRAQRRAEDRGLMLEWQHGRGELLPLEDERFDSVVSIDVLCSVLDVDAVLAEAYRVLRRGGHLHFLEHGLATDERTRRWQRRLNGVNKLTAGGCHLTREPEKHLRASRFVIDDITHAAPLPGTGVLYPHIRGIASRPA